MFTTVHGAVVFTSGHHCTHVLLTALQWLTTNSSASCGGDLEQQLHGGMAARLVVGGGTGPVLLSMPSYPG